MSRRGRGSVAVMATVLVGWMGVSPVDLSAAAEFHAANPTELRDAILAAQDEDIIHLPWKGTFVMDSIFDEQLNFMGPTATPMITKKIYIEANGTRIERLSSGPRMRAFAIGDGGHLILRNAHVKGFRMKGGDGASGGGGGLGAGGAVYVYAGNLNVESCTFEGNGVLGGSGRDGAFTAGGGGGGLGGNGGPRGPEGFSGGGGGGGARGNGGGGGTQVGNLSAGGGGGGGTFDDGMDGPQGSGPGSDGGDENGGDGGACCDVCLDQGFGGEDGDHGGPGGGGGGGATYRPLVCVLFAGSGGNGGYGGGGGGSGTDLADGGSGGFGGGVALAM